MNDWMKAVRSPIRYRVNNTVNLKFNSKTIFMSITFLLSVFLIFLLTRSRNDDYSSNHFINKKISYDVFDDGKNKLYNSTYPLTEPFINKNENLKVFRLMAIADLDTNSKIKPNDPKYSSYLLNGKLTINNDHNPSNKVFIEFDSEPIQITTQYAYGDRGMELSELVVFNGKLYSCDDRTGIIYEIDTKNFNAIPWVILVDGDGISTSKGFKCEWMSVKDEKLFIGGLGKEWTTAKGVMVNHNPQWVKVVGHLG
jgi:soluble calcium-activated nucleotidase 1